MKKLMLAGLCLVPCIQAAQAQLGQIISRGAAASRAGAPVFGQNGLSAEEGAMPMKALPYYEENQVALAPASGLSAEEANLPMRALPYEGNQVGVAPTGRTTGLLGTNRNMPDLRDDFGTLNRR